MLTLGYVSLWKVLAPFKGPQDDFKAVWQLRPVVPYALGDLAMWSLIIMAWNSVTSMAILCLLVLAEHTYSRYSQFKQVEYVSLQVQKHVRFFCNKYKNVPTTHTLVNTVYFNPSLHWLVVGASVICPFVSYQLVRRLKQNFYSFYVHTTETTSNGTSLEYHTVFLTGLNTFCNVFFKTKSEDQLKTWVEFLFLHELQHVKQFQHKAEKAMSYELDESRSYNFYDIPSDRQDMYISVMKGLHALFTSRQLSAVAHEGLLELDADLQTVYQMSKAYAPREVMQIWRHLRNQLSNAPFYLLSQYVAKHITVSSLLHSDSYEQFLLENVKPVIESESCIQVIKALEAQEYGMAESFIASS